MSEDNVKMDRRTSTALLTGTLASPRASWAQAKAGASIFYASGMVALS